ncbi:MAG TPA: glycosyltransferase [Lacipirellulaceae bacterium]
MQFDPELDTTSSCAVDDEATDFGFRVSDFGLRADADNPQSAIRNPQSNAATRPLRVLFMQTDMRIGGAEMITASVIRRLDRDRFAPELCCLKERGALGEELAAEIPVHHGLLCGKYDLRVWPRLTRLLRRRHIDAVITVGAGDKMFWGRLAAWRSGVPVIVSALHSTGWPDCVGRLNRLLTPVTDAFIAVAESHGKFLVEQSGFPENKVAVIRNGVDTDRFAPGHDVVAVRRELGLGETDPVVGIVAALRPEKNHELFLELARRVKAELATASFLVVGEGPRRAHLERMAGDLGLQSSVRFLGARSDVPRLLSAMDVFALTSHVEANPVSILEAMSIGRPVVATNVGSIHEAVIEGQTGFLVPPGDAAKFADRILQLLHAPLLAHSMGIAGRQTVVRHWSLESMVGGYERVIESVYERKSSVVRRPLSVAAS